MTRPPPGLYPAGKGQIGHSRDFLLKNGDGIGGKASFGDVAVGDGGICPGGNHDLIVATLRNRDQRDSGRGVRPLDARDIDARLHQRRQGQVGETVAANGANHLRARTGTRGGERLIGTLAAGERLVGGADDGFAGSGQAVNLDDEIEIDRTEDEDHASCRPFHARARPGAAGQAALALSGAMSTPASQ